MVNSFNQIKHSIDRGLNFLFNHQLNWGEFKTLACWNPWLVGSYFDSSPFVTSFVLYSLKGIEDERVKIMTKKAIDFLLAEQEKGGIWRYWTSRNRKHLPPDLDDISCISFILKSYRVKFDDNLPLILKNRNNQGLFLTWIIEKELKNSFFWKLAKKDVDCVVNANVLTFLGENEPTVCSYINQIIHNNRFSSSYYPSKLAFYYMVSRAFRNKVSCFEKNQEIIIKSTLNLLKKNGSFGNDLETALALNTLFNFNYYGKEVKVGINNLLKNQLGDGSWKKALFYFGVPFWFLALPPGYNYYGSPDLTTALGIEALKNYLNFLTNR